MAWFPWSTAPATPVIIVNDEVGLRSPGSSVIGWGTIRFNGTVNVTTLSGKIVNTNMARKYIHFINNSNNIIWLQYGMDAMIGRGVKLNTGGVLSLAGAEVFLGEFYAVSNTDVLIDVLEGEL